MSAEIIMLGTGNAMATKCYNTCFLLNNDNDFILVDAGGGNEILRRLELADLDYNHLHNLIITHAHTDHILGVFWVIRKIASLMLTAKYQGDFTIYCHDEVATILQTMCQFMMTKKIMSLIGNRIKIKQVMNKEQLLVSGLELIFFDIYSTKMKQYGFQVSLPDQRKLTCLGDEPYSPNNLTLVQNSTWLMCEAFCLHADKDYYKPYEKNHSTALDAGKIASELGILNLILYHTEDDHLDSRKRMYAKEAGQSFSGRIYVPDDMERISLV